MTTILNCVIFREFSCSCLFW